MHLLDLSAEEIAFLALPLDRALVTSVTALDDATSDFAQRLGRSLALTLRARLRAPVVLLPCVCEAVSGSQPGWRVSHELAALWLTRRLGAGAPDSAASAWREARSSGRGTGGYVPPALLHMLNSVLAERWLDAPAPLPVSLAWRLSGADSDIALALDLPSSAAAMQRWAREIVAS